MNHFDQCLSLLAAALTGFLISKFFLIVNEVEKLPKDLTWFGPLWKAFLSDYDHRWNSISATLKSKGIKYTSERVDSSESFGSGSRTHVHIIGDQNNPVLLMLPGFRSSSLMWIAHLDELICKKFCVICLDYPFDLGRSNPGCKTSLTRMNRNGQKLTNFAIMNHGVDIAAVWVNEVMRNLQVKEIDSIVGYSLGASVATNVAIHSPDLLRSKAKLFLAAPPATFSSMPIKTILPFMKSFMWSKITGLPMQSTGLEMFLTDYSRELKAGTAEQLNMDEIMKSFDASGAILSLVDTTPPVPLAVKMLSNEELKFIQERFNPTYLCLEWDCFYYPYIGLKKAKEVGIETIFVKDTTHMFCATQPNKFRQSLLSVLL